jgi:inosine/xanthosine triphosphate pyrophosphatase family protein/ribosomal protein S18 acetylase RimI-like enzyme
MSAATKKRLLRATLRSGDIIEVARLSHRYAAAHAERFLEIHNQIPYVNWDVDDLLADCSADGRPYYGRWQLSLVALHGRVPVGLLVAYLRQPDERHPTESVYIHRLAVAPEWQAGGVGTALMRAAVSWYFEELPWLLTVTSQTNDEPTNQYVLAFYDRLGFERTYCVLYPEKRDILLELERSRVTAAADVTVSRQPVDLSGTPFSVRPRSRAPEVYFGTSSESKLAQYRDLMRCYGLTLRRLHPIVSLVEPQVDGDRREDERALVAEPLKWFSRFAALSGTYPIVIEDTMLLIEHFSRNWIDGALLPGPDTKRWWQALGAEGVLELMGQSTRRRARYICQLGVSTGPGFYRTFRAEIEGSIATAVRISPEVEAAFPLANGTYFHRIFIPDGAERTLGEMEPHEFVRHDYRRSCLAQAVELLHAGARQHIQESLFTEG